MRIPLPVQLKTRQGNVTKDARIKNGYVEIKGEVGRVRKRPGNTDLGLIEAGAAQLLTCWNGLLSVVADSLASLVVTTVPPGYDSTDISFDSSPTFTPSDPEFSVFEYVNGEFLGGIYNEDDTLGVLLSINESGGIVALANRIDSGSAIDTTPYGAAASATTIAIVTRNDYGYGSFEGEIWTAPLAAVPYVFTQKSTSGTYSGQKVRYGGSKFAAILTDFTTASRVRRSTDDGATWQSVSIAAGALYDCCYDGSLWLFGGLATGPVPLVMTSSDLITFNTVTTSGLPGSGQITSVAYSSVHDYFFLTINAGGVYKSSDGTTWSSVTVDDVGYTTSNRVCSNSAGEVFLSASVNVLAQYGVDGDQFTTIGDPYGVLIAANGMEFVTGGDVGGSTGQYSIVTETDGGDEVTATPITDLSPVTPSLALFAEATGSAQSSQQLFIKSDDQAWIYTR